MSTITLDSKVPEGAIQDRWDQPPLRHEAGEPGQQAEVHVIVVGTGLAGASAAATLAELGYKVKCFTFHDSPRRAHSIAAQGGINAAKNYQNDGDSVYRLFYDTVKGGDFRSREANVYRLAQVSVNIIDQCVAQGVPFAREYGGLLDNRSFGGAQVSRTFYARGQTGQQLLLGAYQALMRQVAPAGSRCTPGPRCSTSSSRTASPRHRRPRPDHRRGRDATSGHAVVLATGGYGNVFYLSTNAMNCNVTAAWRAYKRGALFANPCYTQIHPTCIPASGEFQSKLTLMSESLRNDGRIWVPKKHDDNRPADQIPEDERDYYLERKYPAFGNLVPRDVASRAAKTVVDEGRGVGPLKNGVYLDFADAIERLGGNVIEERYGNLFEMYERITDENPYQDADAHLPRLPLHDGRAVGGLQPDEHHPRPVRPRRGQLLRSRRQPPGRLRAHAGPGRRLLRHPLHRSATTSPRCSARPRRAPTTRRSPSPSRRSRDEVDRLLSVRRHQVARRTSTASSARSCGTTAAWPATRRACEKALVGDPRAARGVLEERPVLGDRRRAQPVAREGRPRGRLHRARRADVPRRPASARSPAAATSARSTRPPRARRSATTRTSPTSPPGSARARATAQTAPQGAARVRVRPADPAQLQVSRGHTGDHVNLTLKVWRQDSPSVPGRFETYQTSRRRRTTCRSSRCSTSSTSG